MNVTDLIQAFGGYDRAGTVLGVSRTLLADWETKGLPAKRWQQIALLSETYAREPLTLEQVAEIGPSKPKVAA